MSRPPLSWSLLALCGLGWGCGAGEETATEPTNPSATTQQQAPEPPPLPKPLMRQAMHCCKNLTMEPVVRAYLALGNALAAKDLAGVATHRDALTEALGAANLGEDKLAAFKTAVAAMDLADLAAARTSYAAASEALVTTVEASQAGVLDLAVAYSREADAHWLQEGVQPKSPYGDGINSYSWGTRADVKAADQIREQELGNRP